MSDRVGQQIGNYRLVKLLGKGGFAEVYLGQHVHLASKQAAIKLLHLLDVDVKKFQEEAETTEKLVHPHIVRLLDFALEEGTPFLVLDYAPGGSLRSRHPQGSIVPLEIVTGYLKEIGPALQYAHDLHILHRDIKPDNVLIGRQGELLVSDFGIAVLTQTGRTSLSSAYGVGGTPYYMAPETYQGRPVKESDQYALAVMVYEWLCGSVPFTEGNFIQLGYQHTYTPVPPLREKNLAISPYVETVVLKALAKEPKGRFGSVQLFAQAFEQASIRTLPATKPQQGQGRPEKQSPPDQSSRQQGKGQSSQQLVVQTPHSVQDETGGVGKAPPRSVPPEVTPVGKTELPLETPVVTPPNQSAVSMEKATSPNQSLLPTEPVTTPRPLVKPTVPVPPPGVSSSRGTSAPSTVVVPPRRITRRTMLFLGLVGAGATVIGIGWWAYSQGQQVSSPTPQLTPQLTATQTLTITPPNKLLYTYRDTVGVQAVAWSPDGKRIASGAISASVWNAADGSNAYTYTGHSAGSTVYSVAWSPDGKRIASGGNDNTVQVWDAANGANAFIYRGHSDIVQAVAWSPDGKRIASGGNDKTVQVWDAANGGNAYKYTGHQRGVFNWVGAVAWSPDGKRIASGSTDNTVQVWDAANGGHVFTYQGHFSGVYSVAWSPDGKRIASGGTDNTVQVWDPANGGYVFTYHEHSSGVHSVAWSPDGKRIASGCRDDTVQVWDAMTGTKYVTYTGHSDQVNSVAWSPDGKFIASGSDDKTAQIWQAV